jgi:N utilization substance protein A
MDLKTLILSAKQIAEERGISVEKVIETIESAIAAAYKKEYGTKGQIIKCKFDSKTGDLKFWQIKIVVDESMLLTDEELKKEKNEKKKSEESSEKEDLQNKKFRFNPERHIMIEEAKKIEKDVKPGDEIEFSLKTEKDFGRIATQTAKQVALQKIKEIERNTIFEEYKAKEGEIVSGIVQRVEGKNVYFDIGKTSGILPKEEQIQGEFYRPGARLKLFVLKVENTSRGPMIYLSRAYPKFVSKLFELESPEVANGTVVIKSIAREAGSRTKVAVASTVEGVDPVGSVVGQRGTRVQAVIQELGGEKIDVIEWSEDPQKYIANSLSPAKVLEVKILPKNKAQVIVSNEQLSLAIGRDGQNVRLAAKLTGWKIDVRSPEGIGKESDGNEVFESGEISQGEDVEENTQETEQKETKEEKAKEK